MPLDPTNPVVALCAEGVAIEGDAAAARARFERAWERFVATISATRIESSEIFRKREAPPRGRAQHWIHFPRAGIERS